MKSPNTEEPTLLSVQPSGGTFDLNCPFGLSWGFIDRKPTDRTVKLVNPLASDQQSREPSLQTLGGSDDCMVFGSDAFLFLRQGRF